VTSTGGQQAHQGNGGINRAAIIGANINLNTAARVQQYAPNWVAQQVATIIGSNTLAAITDGCAKWSFWDRNTASCHHHWG